MAEKKNLKKEEIKQTEENNTTKKKTKSLIDQKQLEEKELDAIKDVIKKNKKEKKNRADKQAKYKEILKNILIALVLSIYFLILIIAKAIAPTIEYITCLKFATIAEVIALIIIFEISYKKDKEELFMHGIEMMCITGATIIYLHLFSMQNDKLNMVGAVIIGIISVYYLIKSLVIALKKDKKK